MKNTDKIINGTIAALLIAGTVNPVYASEIIIEEDVVVVIEEDVIVEDVITEDTTNKEENIEVEMDPVEEVVPEPVPEVEIEVGEAWTPNKPNATRPAQNVVEADPVEETVVVEEELTVEADVAVKKTPEEKRQEMQEVVRKTNNNILSVLNKLKIKR